MTNLMSKSIYRSILAKGVLLGLMALCGASGPVFGQEMVAGKFTLTENTRLGKRVLPAGTYTFSIKPTGAMQSVSSIQGAREVVQVVVRPESEAGPVTLMFAMAVRNPQPLDSSKLILEAVNNEMVAHSMYLDQQGLLLDLDWMNAKDKSQMIAQAARPEPAPASKSTD